MLQEGHRHNGGGIILTTSKALSRQQKYVGEVAYMHYYFFYSETTIKDPKKAPSMYPLMKVLFHLTLTDDNTTGFKKIKFLPWGRY